MTLSVTVVHSSDVPLHPTAVAAREKRIQEMGVAAAQKGQPDYDWARISFVAERLRPGPAIMDVGPGFGHFLRILIDEARFERFHAIDIVPRPTMPAPVDFQICSIDALAAADAAYDTVTCMEVLEHLDDQTLERGLANIRRICKRQLFMSVPFCEPTPLPKYHQQRFTPGRVRQMFPDARYTLFLKEPVTRTPWLMIEESFSR